MTERVRRRRAWWAVWIAAVAAVPAALLLAVLAVDVLRLSDALANDDRRFQTSPLRQAGLWDVDFIPGDPGIRLLALRDDVEFRRLVGLYLRVEPGRVDFQGFPDLEALRARAQFELTRESSTEPDHRRRSRLLTLFGVMTLDKVAVSEEEHVNFPRAALEAFRAAIALDPENEDAKTNLETLLRVFGPVTLSGQAPSGGRNRGDVSGQGSAGSGY